MDEPWVIERLEWWIKIAKAARVSEYSPQKGHRTFGYMLDTHKSYAQMRAVSAQTHSIICRVLNRDESPSLMRRSDDAYWVNEGIESAEHALAVVKTRAETREKLGTTAPTMKADALHSLIWEAASKRWDSGHYTDAVQRAATALSGIVKDQTGRYELNDSDLVSQAFSLSPAAEGKPRLRWPGNDDDLNVKTMRVGILNMAQGVFAAIRNPATHSTDELPKEEALEQLATLSILARWIDRCELVTA